MRTWLLHLWETLTSGYWFVPTVMLAASVLLAMGLLYIDQVTIGQADLVWLYSGGPEGARSLLATVAGSVITVAGVVFSITIAALTQAASQFGPRLLRNFMRDTSNQFVLGMFVATFMYCLIVLRTIHGEQEGPSAFVPHLSVTVAVVLAAASIAVLIYFIHHVSYSLQAPAVVAAAHADMKRVLVRIPYDAQGASTPTVPIELPDFDHEGHAVSSSHEGYVQAVDFDHLIRRAARSDVVIRLSYRPGNYVISGSTLARVWPADRCDADLSRAICQSFICGVESTAEQDVEYALRQIVEVAVRALSTGVNDPFTAVNCVDVIGSAVCHIARCGLPGRLHFDEAGRLRIVSPVTDFPGVLDTAFNQIRQNSRGDVAVTVRLLETLHACSRQMTTPAHRAALLAHGMMVFEQARAAITESHDLHDVHDRWRALRDNLSDVAHAGGTSRDAGLLITARPTPGGSTAPAAP